MVTTASPTWSLSGPDRSKFGITAAGVLTFMNGFTPDYEMSVDANMDNVYEVTVVATVAGMSGTRDVRVTVENIEELGAVTLNRTPPRVGLPVTATLTDPDGSISGLTWQWSINDDIEGATSDTYVPKAEDVDGILTATAMYDDGHSSEGSAKKTAMVAAVPVEVDTRNKPPAFVDQDADMDGVQNTTAERKVDENTGADAIDDAADVADVVADNVGSAVTANDPDPNTDPLIYTLSGADAGLFRVSRDNTTTQNANDGGQIEVASGTELDYEDRSSYEVTLTAEDSFGDRVSIAVTIMVTDMDEAPEIMRTPDANVAPGFASATTSRTVAENMAAGEDIGNPVAANDANGDALTYTLGGADAAPFDIDPATGQLSTKAALDYETKATYSVTVTARDSGGLRDSIDVTITVTNVEEVGMLTGDASDDYAENGTAAVGTYTADGPVAASWSLEGDDMGAFSIGGSSGELMFASPPDFEAPTDMGMDNMYQVTVKAEAGGEMDMMDVTVTVTNVEEIGMLTGNASVDYPENDTVAVETYMADGPVAASWSVEGDDMEAFTIGSSSGELMFRSPPDFEAPADMGMVNMYMVTVMAEAGGEMDMMEVMVTVTDMDEDGVVTLMPATAPVVGTPVTATLDDPDGGVTDITWQWHTVVLPGEPLEITGETGETYTPVGGDVGVHLQAEATYTDAHGMQTKEQTTDGVVVSRNTAPEFPATETGDRSVAENTAAGDNVGDPVTAMDADRDDTLTYALSGTDAASFDIDEMTGQLMTKDALDSETKASYMVVVTATDGSGANDTQMVTITVTDVDEQPVVAGEATSDYPEKGEAAVAAYTGTDPEGVTVTWSLSGDDAEDFEISEDGMLTFKESPNFEAPADMDTNNVYMVTVEARDGTTDNVMQAVTVTVTNVDEPGMVTLWAGEDPLTMAPQVGDTITGLVVDPDGTVTGEMWQWSRTMDTADMSSWMPITGATGAAYMVTEGDTGYHLRVVATYTDAAGTDMAMVYSPATMMVNTAPEFASATTSRTVAENTAAGEDIGNPVAANDANGDTLAYTLGGADVASFDIDPDTGQLMTLAALDYETKDTYSVTVTARDSGGLRDSIDVTITVTDVDDAEAGDTLLDRYDDNKNGQIDRPEVLDAIRDFVFNQTIERDDVVAVIRLFVFGR